MNQALLEIDALSVQFRTPRGTVRAVDGVNLSVSEGQTLALVGESGSGKSVTALSLLQLFHRADGATVTGRICWRQRDGHIVDLNALPERDRARFRGADVAVIFQDPGASLNPVFTVGAQLFETIIRHQPGEDPRSVALRLLRDVGIADPDRRLKSYPHQLSGGMRQRVMIAIALACKPRLLVADEPTTALDVTIQAQIVGLLNDLKERFGMALLFITHDLGLVAEIADRVAVMYAGQVVESGPVDDVLETPAHPYTQALLDCRPRRVYRDDGTDERVLRPISGSPPSPLVSHTGCRFASRCVQVEPACVQDAPALLERAGARNVRCFRAVAPA